jgi:HSP20 family protein
MRDPREIKRIHAELEELFADLWQVPAFAGLRRGFRPHVDCYRTDDPAAVTVIVDLAGVEPTAVHVDVTDRTVVVSGERPRPELHCRASYRQMELEYGPFQRRITLAEDVDPTGAEATYEHGLLRIVLPLAQKPREGKVSIRLGEQT